MSSRKAPARPTISPHTTSTTRKTPAKPFSSTSSKPAAVSSSKSNLTSSSTINKAGSKSPSTSHTAAPSNVKGATSRGSLFVAKEERQPKVPPSMATPTKTSSHATAHHTNSSAVSGGTKSPHAKSPATPSNLNLSNASPKSAASNASASKKSLTSPRMTREERIAQINNEIFSSSASDLGIEPTNSNLSSSSTSRRQQVAPTSPGLNIPGIPSTLTSKHPETMESLRRQIREQAKWSFYISHVIEQLKVSLIRAELLTGVKADLSKANPQKKFSELQIRFNDFIEDAILQYQRVKSHGGWEAIEARLKSLPNVANASNRATQADKILSEILGNNYEIDQLSQFLAQREDDSRLVDEIRNEFGDEITVRDLTLVESQDNSHLGKMTRELFENQGNEKLTEDQIIEQLKDLKAKLNDYKDNTLIAEEARLLTNNENHEETIENLQSTFKLANNVRNIISSNNDIELSEKLSQSVALMKELQELLEVNADSIPEKVRSLQQNTLNQDLQNELEEVKKQRQNFENELWETKKLLTAAQDEELFAKKVRAIYGNSDDNDNLICAKNDHNLASAIRIIYENQNVSDEFIPQSIVRDHDLATPIRELFQLADDNAIIEKIRNNQSEASDNSLIGNLSNKLEAIRNVKLAEQLKEELTQETERVQSLTSELDKLRNELNEKSNELENLKNEFNNTNSQIQNQDQANNNELNNIRNELNSKNEELNNLRNEIENKNNEINNKNNELNHQNGELENLHNEINSKNNEIENKNNELNSKNEEINGLKRDQEFSQRVRNIFPNDSDENIPEYISKDVKLASRVRGIFQSGDDAFITESIENNKNASSTNAQEHEALNNTTQALSSLRQELESKNNELNSKNGELDNLRNELSNKNNEINGKNGELDNLRNELSNKDAELEQKNNELNEKSNELENLKNEFNNTNSQIRNQDQANNNELNNIRNELNSKNEELNNLRNEIENKNNELNSKNEEINGLKRDQEFSQRVRNIFPNDSDENIPEYISKDVKLASRVRGIFQSGDDAFITESIENNKNASSTNAQEHEALNNTTQALSSLRQELESKNNELNSKNGELDNLRNELSNKNNEIESKSNELNSLRNELENNNNEFNSKSTELDNLRNELNNLRNELNDKNSQLQNLDQETTNEYNNLRNEIKSKNDEINHIRDEISHKNNELNAKNSELENLHNEINNKNDELDRLRNELSNSQNEIGLKNNEHAHLIEELNRHKNQLEALQNEINTQQQQHQAQQQADQGQNNEEIERLRKELEDTKEELKNALEDLEGRDQDIESLHAKILELGGANTSKEIEDLTAKLAQMVLLRKEAEDLKNQLENVSAELDLVKSDRDQYIARLEQANINAARADNEKNDLSHKLELYKASNIHQDVDDNTSSEFESLSKANAAYAAENAALTASLNDHREDHAFAEKLRNILPGDNDDARLGAAAADHKLSESIRSIFTNDSDDSIPVYVSRDCSFSKDIRVFFSSGDDSAMLQRIKDNESQIQSLKQKDSDSGAVKLEIEALKSQNNALQAKLDKANEIAEKAVANEAFATRFRDVTRGNTDDDKVYNIQRDTWLAIEIRKIFEDSHADETIPRRVKDLIDEHENLKNEKSNLLTQLNNLLNNNNTSADVENQTNEEIDALKAQLRLFAGLVSAEDCTNEECFDRLKQNTNLANSVRNQFNYPNSDRDNEIPQYISKDMALASTIRVLFSSGDDEMIVERIKSNEFRSSQELIEARTNFDRLNNIFSTIRAIVIESGNVDVEHFLEDQIVDEVRETFRFAKECRESQDSNDSSLLDSILTLFKPGTTPESIKQWKNRLVQSVDTFTANEDLLADIREIFELASAENLPNIIKEMREEGDPTLTRNADIVDEAMKGSNLKVEIEVLMTMVLVLFTQYMLVPPEQ